MDTDINFPKNSSTIDNKDLVLEISRLTHSNEQLQRSKLIQDTLLAISNIATKATSVDQFYQSVHQYLKKIIPADNFFVATKDPTTGFIRLPFFSDEQDSHPTDLYPDEEISQLLSTGLTGYALRREEAFLCNSEKFEQLIKEGEIRHLGSSCHQWLGVPIKNQDVTSGVLVVQSYKEHITYGELEIELMGFISHHISGVMERLQHHEQLEIAIEERTRELSQAYDKLKIEVQERVKAEQLQKALFEIASLSSSSIHQSRFYIEIHQIISQLIPAQNCFIALKNGNQLSFPFYVSQRTEQPPTSRPMKDGLSELILATKKPALFTAKDILHLINTKKIYHIAPELNKTQTMHQWIGIPLVIDGEVKGALTVYSEQEQEQYHTKDLELLTFVSQHIANAMERKQAVESLKQSHEQLEDKVVERTQALEVTNNQLQIEIEQRRAIEAQLLHDALHDALTGLPNRTFLMDRLSQAIKHNRRHGRDPFALLFIDLDRFKLINDTLGHQEGDRFLIETAKRLNACIRDNDTLARMGGDEFVVLLDSIGDIDDAKEVCERILQAVSQPYTLANQQFHSSASIGLTYCNKQHFSSSESLLKNADTAMYQAKANGKGCYVIYDKKLGQVAESKQQLEQEFKLALKQQTIKVSFQQIMDFEQQKVVAVEPRLSWITPSNTFEHTQLIELAEQYQLMLHVDGYMFSYINRNHHILEQEYGANTMLHLPISSQHLKNKYVLRNLKNTIKQSKIDLSSLQVFFSEKALVQDLESHINGFDMIASSGIKIGISGYGVGYSALSNLSFLPINALKLDEAICQHLINPRQVNLIKSYLLSANAMGYQIFTSGIDTPTQQQAIQQLGFKYGQGEACQFSLFSQPDTA